MACAAIVALQAGTTSVALGDGARSAHPAHQDSKLFSCDPARFHGDPHYAKVRLTKGAVASLHLLRTEDGEEVVTAHPYGVQRAIPTADTRELCMSTDRLQQFVEQIERRQQLLARRGRAPRSQHAAAAGATAPGPESAGAAVAYNTGLLIGWNEATGQAPGECYNFTTSTPANHYENLNFSSENAARSVAEQTRVSATVSGAFGAFSASANFSYSDQWQSSANSGSAYFNIASIYTLNSVIDQSNPLTAQGENAGDQFASLCGVDYMASVPGGMVATIAVAYGTSSETAKHNIDAGFKTSFGLDSLKAAVDESNKVSDSSSYLTVRLNIIGGGSEASHFLTAAFGAGDSDGAYVDQCSDGDVDACEEFISKMGDGAIGAANAFNTLVQDPPQGNLNFYALFPSGVAGATTTPLVTEVADAGKTDVLKGYGPQLTAYLALVNQIATLSNRVQHLSDLVGQTSFNPVPILDLQDYLGPLLDSNPDAVSYANDRATVLADLGRCLDATQSNVLEVCAPILNGGATIESAYNWYDADIGYPRCTSGDNTEDCWLAQQNTIALQYAATYDNGRGHSWPEDVIYIDAFPPFTGEGAPIAGNAGLVAFTDQPFFDAVVGAKEVKEQRFAVVNIVPLQADPQTNLSLVYTATDPSMKTFNIFGFVNDPDKAPVWDDSNQAFAWTTTTCRPTFDEPCPIGYKATVLSVEMDQIDNFFTTN